MNTKWIFCLLFLLMFSSIQAQDKMNEMSEQKSSAQRWQIGIQGGTGYLLANINDVEEDFSRKLKWGHHHSADLHYMLNQQRGIGIKYSGFYTSAGSYTIIDIGDGLKNWCINMKKRIYTNFIGLSFRTQQYFTRSDKFKITSDIALGYAHYRDEEENDHIQLSNLLLKSGSPGINLELSIEYSLLSWVSIGATASCFGSWFWKGTFTDGYNSTTVKFKDAQMDNINASRLDLSLGVKIYF